MHAHAAPGRWCYELGTLPGLDFADQLWVSRYLLLKLAERHGLVASLEPQVRALSKVWPVVCLVWGANWDW